MKNYKNVLNVWLSINPGNSSVNLTAPTNVGNSADLSR